MGYYFTATNEYDILWTMPQCILAMRMVGLITDMYDGHQSKVRLGSVARLKEGLVWSCGSLVAVIAKFDRMWFSFRYHQTPRIRRSKIVHPFLKSQLLLTFMAVTWLVLR